MWLSERDRAYLNDILDLAEELSGYVQDMSEDAFLADRLCQRAVERVLTVIGEASKQLTPDTRARIDQPWRDIMRFRDKGIHAYNTITPAAILEIALQDVPDLAQAIRDHLETYAAQSDD